MDKVKKVKDSITQVGIPKLLDEIVEASEIRQAPYELEITESGSYSVKASEIDAEQRQEQGLTPWDGLAQVDVTVDIPSAWITTMEDKEYDSIEDAEELNMMDVKYALFSYNQTTGKYHVWNAGETKAWDGDEDASANYNPGTNDPYTPPSWDAEVEFPENEYGEVIAVCCGKGLWVSTKWASATLRKWCESSSPMYAYQWDCGDLSGAQVARKLYAADKDLSDSIFATIKDFESIENDGTKGHYFLPSRSEIFQVVYNCALENLEAQEGNNHYTYTNAYYNATHIIALSGIWSCSQFVYSAGGAYGLSSASDLGDTFKVGECCSAVCLRFGSALAPTEAATEKIEDASETEDTEPK